MAIVIRKEAGIPPRPKGTGLPARNTVNLQIEQYITQKKRDLHLPGLAVAIVQEGAEDEYHTLGKGITPQTEFIIGSLSKSFTALAIMQLVDAGKINLDGTVAEYIHWFSYLPVTIRQLLTHSSGISRYAGRELLSGNQEDKTIEQSVRELCQSLKLAHRPGEKYEYSNCNYLILSLIIEYVSDIDYADYICSNILDPLEMHHTHMTPSSTTTAQGHRWMFGRPIPFNAPFLKNALGAAFIVSCAEDMAKWLRFHMSNGEVGGQCLLSPAGMQELHAAQIQTMRAGSHAAMGWRIEAMNGEIIWRHGGEVSNFRADMLIAPNKRIGVISLQNCNNGLIATLGIDQIAANIMKMKMEIPLKKTLLNFSRYYKMVNTAVILSTILQSVAWTLLAFSPGPTLLKVVLLAILVVVTLAAFRKLPHVKFIDMPWKGLHLYVTDIAYWLICMGILDILFSILIIVKWLAA